MASSKVELREAMLTKRRNLDAALQKKSAQAVADQLELWLLEQEFDAHNTNIAAYVSMLGEVNLDPAIVRLEKQGYHFTLPCVEPHGKQLAFRQWKVSDMLIKGAMSTMQPGPSNPQLTPDIILVPLIAVDASGHRLGYGGGYYDATLEALRRQNNALLAVGIAYDFQYIDTMEHRPHDQPMDAIITETQRITL